MWYNLPPRFHGLHTKSHESREAGVEKERKREREKRLRLEEFPILAFGEFSWCLLVTGGGLSHYIVVGWTRVACAHG